MPQEGPTSSVSSPSSVRFHVSTVPVAPSRARSGLASQHRTGRIGNDTALARRRGGAAWTAREPRQSRPGAPLAVPLARPAEGDPKAYERPARQPHVGRKNPEAGQHGEDPLPGNPRDAEDQTEDQ